MPKISFPSQSRFLTKDDFPHPQVCTIAGVGVENMDDGTPKHVLFVAEHQKGVALNQVNGNVLISMLGDDTDAWGGHKITIYTDPHVSFGGRVVGGIRIGGAPAQAPQVQAPQVQAPQAPPQAPQAPPQAAQTDPLAQPMPGTMYTPGEDWNP